MLLLAGSGRALGLICWIRPCAEITVGRKDATLTIEGDHSVSRRHAVLVADGPAGHGFRITDAGSKFGLEINEKKLASGATVSVYPGDSIQFGAQGAVFTAQTTSVLLYISKMHQDAQLHVSNEAKMLGFGIVDSIADCTHVVMPVVSVTRTLLRSLVLGRRIVSPEFLSQSSLLGPTFRVPVATAESITRFINNQEFLPSMCLPPMAKDNSVALDSEMLRPNGKRQTLFNSKMFLFADEAQHDHFKGLVADARGCSDVLVDIKQVQNIISGSSTTLVCLVLPHDSSSDAGKRVYDIARHLHLRPISESEIGLSILLASTVEHTNPKLAKVEPLINEHSAARTHDLTSTNDSAATETNTARSKRRRAAPRISNFWSSMVSSSVALPDQEQMQEQIQAHTADSHLVVPESPPPANTEQSEPTGNSEPNHQEGETIQAADPASRNAPKFHPSLTDLSSSLDDLALQPGSLIAVIPVPLVKTKPAISLTASDLLLASVDVPNYKRFKKTVHIYQ